MKLPFFFRVFSTMAFMAKNNSPMFLSSVSLIPVRFGAISQVITSKESTKCEVRIVSILIFFISPWMVIIFFLFKDGVGRISIPIARPFSPIISDIYWRKLPGEHPKSKTLSPLFIMPNFSCISFSLYMLLAL